MNGLPDIDAEIEELHRILEEDVDNHYQPGKECLSESHHFELWDRMFELYKEQLKRKEKVNPTSD